PNGIMTEVPVPSGSIGLHPQRPDPRAHAIITQRGEKHPYTRTLAPTIDDKKIVVFRRNREKAETVQLCYRFNGESPVRALLSHCGGDRVVRFRLIGIASGAHTTEQFVG